MALQDWGDYSIGAVGQLTPEQVASTADIAWAPTHAAAMYPVTTGDSLRLHWTAQVGVGHGR
ncbi:hypothetical protein [Polaromonas sp.]|uniref:hypothetical protein n=1 Tax=Polaromonas sp. TaxID=1869339 RepID=UPI001D51FF60|nr:hypothetical protein [Polaromonas sp.]MBT9474269.1 hypothetical protein [Polaromonas sp.]